MLIAAETVGSVSEDTRKERLLREGEQEGKDRKKKEKEGERGKGEDVGPLKEDAARIHSWVTLLWTHNPKTFWKGDWVGQWSDRNRAQAEISQCCYKRPHISDSAEQEVGGEEGTESEEEVQGHKDVVGWWLAFRTCMGERKRGRVRRRVFFSPEPPALSVFSSVDLFLPVLTEGRLTGVS